MRNTFWKIFEIRRHIRTINDLPVKQIHDNFFHFSACTLPSITSAYISHIITRPDSVGNGSLLVKGQFSNHLQASQQCVSTIKQFSTNNKVDTSDDLDIAVAPSRAAPDGTAPRFYGKASASPSVVEVSYDKQADRVESPWWVVKLDHRVLKTPAKKEVKVATEALALAIAAEWEWQEGKQIRPYTMPLMKLVATAIDQIPLDRHRVIQQLLKYFHTDSVCCRVPPSLLADKQKEVWDPLLDWVEEKTGVRPVASSDLFAPDQPHAVVEAMEKILLAVDDWELAAIDSLAGTARSLIIALAIAHERIGITEAMEAIRLEEDFQVDEWGFVEGGHDIDLADLRVRVTAASVFLRLLKVNNL